MDISKLNIIFIFIDKALIYRLNSAINLFEEFVLIFRSPWNSSFLVYSLRVSKQKTGRWSLISVYKIHERCLLPDTDLFVDILSINVAVFSVIRVGFVMSGVNRNTEFQVNYWLGGDFQNYQIYIEIYHCIQSFIFAGHTLEHRVSLLTENINTFSWRSIYDINNFIRVHSCSSFWNFNKTASNAFIYNRQVTTFFKVHRCVNI